MRFPRVLLTLLTVNVVWAAGEDEAVAIVRSWRGEGYYMTLGEAANALLIGFGERGKATQAIGWYAEQTLPTHYDVRFNFLLDGANAEMIFIYDAEEGRVSPANDLARAAVTLATTVKLSGKAAATETVTVGGIRESEDIRAEVEVKKSELQEIYREFLKRNPKAGGKIKVRFTILASGAVGGAEVVESTINYPPLEAALLRRISNWTFAPASNDVTVTYPFIFFTQQP